MVLASSFDPEETISLLTDMLQEEKSLPVHLRQSFDHAACPRVALPSFSPGIRKHPEVSIPAKPETYNLQSLHFPDCKNS